MDINGCCERSALLVYARNLLFSQSFMDLTGRYCTPVQIVCPFLGHAWLPEHPARSPLRRPELLTYTHHTTSSALGALEGELAAEQLLLGSPGIAAVMRRPRPGSRPPSERPARFKPVSSVVPIYEGSFLEGVLLTQLTGDFPGPVLAMVSVPFYSADRQRVLIPRGARVVGTARAVQDPDQSRLAVAFHRLLLPDGSWIDLEFTGLNQAGEGALRDQVDRHYFSTFAAAGAVGVVSGLALAGGSPFGLRAGVGQGLGQSATSVLDRFLNRLPTITIRAGHRLRIWFTSDVLVPRAGTRQ